MQNKLLLTVLHLSIALVCAAVSLPVAATESTDENAAEAQAVEAQDRPSIEELDAEIQRLAAEHNQAQESEDDEVVCKRVAQTGTRFKKMVCRTKRQIEMEEEGGRHLLESTRSGVQNDQGG